MVQPVELPFLIVHGAWVWKVTVVVATLAVLAAARGLRMLVARWIAKIDAREIRSVAAERPAERVKRLCGVLRGGHAATFVRRWSIVHGEIVKFDRAPNLWLDCGGERVELHGDIRVIHGARTVQSRRKLRKVLPRGLAKCGGLWGAKRWTSVADGDVVVVEGPGVVQRADAEAPWILEGQLHLYATVQDAQPRRLGSVALFVAVAMALFGTYRVAKYLGGRAMKAVYRAPDRIASLEELAPYAIAAAMPGTRGEALEALEYALANLNDGNELALRIRLALARQERGCAGEGQVLFENQLFEEALAVADRCGIADLASSSLMWLGRFDELRERVANDEWTYRAAVVAIAGGRWSDAADAAMKRSVKLANETPGRVSAVALRVGAHEYRCRGELFRAWAGDRSAVGRLAKLAAETRTKGCAFALAEVTDEAERWNAFKVAWPDDGDTYNTYLLRALLDGEHARAFSVDAGEAIHVLALRWFGPYVLARWEGRQSQADREMWSIGLWLRALLHLQRGNLDAARADAIESDVVEATKYEWRRRAIESWIALRTDQLSIPSIHPDVVEHAKIRNGTDLPDLFRHRDRCEERGPPAIAAASRGDGRGLAEVLTRCPASWNDYDDLVALLPRIQLGREEVTKQLVHYRDKDATYSFEPIRWVDYAARQRDLRRLLGDATATARWQRIVDNYMNAFSDRRRVVAMYLWTTDL